MTIQNKFYKIISDNIKKKFDITKFTIYILSDGSGFIRCEYEEDILYSFTNVEKLITEFLGKLPAWLIDWREVYTNTINEMSDLELTEELLSNFSKKVSLNLNDSSQAGWKYLQCKNELEFRIQEMNRNKQHGQKK